MGVLAALAVEPQHPLEFKPADLRVQNSQSSSSVLTALPITYDEPEPEKKSWF
jgi:hypothetical protein